MKHLDVKDKGSMIGTFVIRKFKAGTKELIWESEPIRNRVVVSSGYGKNLLARALINDTTYPVYINSASIGTGTNTPADSDTGLQTSVLASIAVASSSATLGVATLSFFIPSATLANGTYTEFGIFAVGRLFARSLITPSFVKASNQDTTIDYTITFT